MLLSFVLQCSRLCLRCFRRARAALIFDDQDFPARLYAVFVESHELLAVPLSVSDRPLES